MDYVPLGIVGSALGDWKGAEAVMKLVQRVWLGTSDTTRRNLMIRKYGSTPSKRQKTESFSVHSGTHQGLSPALVSNDIDWVLNNARMAYNGIQIARSCRVSGLAYVDDIFGFSCETSCLPMYSTTNMSGVSAANVVTQSSDIDANWRLCIWCSCNVA